MRDLLRQWIADADTRGNAASFGLGELIPELSYQEGRQLNLRSTLVGELFDLLRDGTDDPRDWATVGNGLALIGSDPTGESRSETFFLAAAAFYIGGFSASAYLTVRRARPEHLTAGAYFACYELLARPGGANTAQVISLLEGIRTGDNATVTRVRDTAKAAVDVARRTGPEEWVAATVLASLIERFAETNIRAVLPQGDDGRWNNLVDSFLDRRPPVWDFFPSQREAVDAGLLSTEESFSLQMPTGAGKTALTETLIYNHLVEHPADLAVLLVPFRSLGSELRSSLGENLNRMGYSTRTVYGGVVPSPEETEDLDAVRVIIATPESLTGLLDNSPELLERLTLLVCDEGHLLDSTGRGVGLELLLARFRARENPPRIVFVSAIVPNIEEINAWLGGNDETVVRSEFRPADAEYAVLRPSARSGRSLRVNLEMRPPTGTSLPTRLLPGFLTANDFDYVNQETGRHKIWTNSSVKARAVATARKALPLGAVAVFATAKFGDQGVLALARELSDQLQVGLLLPDPGSFISPASADRVAQVLEYLSIEYGDNWTGTTSLRAGAVVHHGDIPQETREVLEELLRDKHIRLVLCTGTLAEGVNLPIRTLVLYSTDRMEGRNRVRLLTREIKNLVGRAGRAGSETKGLVICANPDSWAAVSAVAEGSPGERVTGALIKLLQEANRSTNDRLTNEILEADPIWHALVDGIDATLLELLSDDMDPANFRELATNLADSTYAYQQANARARQSLEDVFALRATRLTNLRATGRLNLAAGTGARARLIDSVLEDLIPRYRGWTDPDSVLDDELLLAVLNWAWSQSDMRLALRRNYPESERPQPLTLPSVDNLHRHVRLWLDGRTFAEIAEAHRPDIDVLLRIHSGVVSYTLATLVEQAIAILGKRFEPVGGLAPVLTMLPDYLRYGTTDPDARDLMANGVRHRRAANLLGLAAPPGDIIDSFFMTPLEKAAAVIEADPEQWRETLGSFVFDRTVRDVGANLGG